MAVDPASIVICAELPADAGPTTRGAGLRGRGRNRSPITWSGSPEAIAATAPAVPTDEIALLIDPSWLESRRLLRERIATARHAAPELAAAVFRGPRPLAQHAVLAEEGIRAVIVDVFGADSRGSRRPAPAGWDCRNPVWGLWEVRAAAESGRGPWGWLNGPLSRPRPGSLRVLHAGRVQLGPTGPVSTRLERFSAWADRRQAGNAARLVTLSDLATMLARGGEPPLAGSVLKAA